MQNSFDGNGLVQLVASRVGVAIVDFRTDPVTVHSVDTRPEWLNGNVLYVRPGCAIVSSATSVFEIRADMQCIAESLTIRTLFR